MTKIHIDVRTKLSLTRWSADWKSATSLYEQAAIGFRLAKKNEKTKEAFEKASKGQEMLSSPWDAAKHIESVAALAKELGNWREVPDFYRHASDLYNECGRSQLASNALAKDKRVSVSCLTLPNNVELIEKPEMLDIDREQEAPKNHSKSTTVKGVTENRLESATSSTKMVNASKINPDQLVEKGNISLLSDHEQHNDSVSGLQSFQQSNFGCAVKTSASIIAPESKLADSNASMYLEVSLNKPARLDQSVKESSNALGEEMILASPESYDSAVELENLLTTTPIKEREDMD